MPPWLGVIFIGLTIAQVLWAAQCAACGHGVLAGSRRHATRAIVLTAVALAVFGALTGALVFATVYQWSSYARDNLFMILPTLAAGSVVAAQARTLVVLTRAARGMTDPAFPVIPSQEGAPPA